MAQSAHTPEWYALNCYTAAGSLIITPSILMVKYKSSCSR